MAFHESKEFIFISPFIGNKQAERIIRPENLSKATFCCVFYRVSGDFASRGCNSFRQVRVRVFGSIAPRYEIARGSVISRRLCPDYLLRGRRLHAVFALCIFEATSINDVHLRRQSTLFVLETSLDFSARFLHCVLFFERFDSTSFD